MSRLFVVLKNKTAAQSFMILIVGFVLILSASIFLFSIYLSHIQVRYSRRHLVRQFVRTVRLVEIVPASKIRQHRGLISGQGIRVQISDQPAQNAPVIYSTRGKDLVKFAEENYKNLHASLPLSGGQWVIISGHVPTHNLYLTGFITSTILVLLFLIFLCYWAVRRLALPVSKFINAAKRFGVDMQAPPMALEGPSEVREVIEAFNEMQSRIRRLLDDRTQMLAAISHDLRTPITRLQLRAEYLQGTPQYDKAIADLKEMEQMISSILSFAKDYARTESIKRFDLNALLESLCNDLSDTGMDVTYHEVAQRVPMSGRVTALKRALTNLIENGVKYGDRVDVELIVSDEKVEVKIADQGPGIPPEEMENVFNPFYRIDPSRTPEKAGSGLGLAVARDIVLSHGGEIKLHNHEPHGLLVTVCLPLN